MTTYIFLLLYYNTSVIKMPMVSMIACEREQAAIVQDFKAKGWDPEKLYTKCIDGGLE